jgi:hypothetical protein
MKPTTYFFALGLALGIGSSVAFFWYRTDNIVEDQLASRTRSLSDGWQESEANLTECRDRLRSAGLPWK